MGKIENLEKYINLCDEKNKTDREKEVFLDEVTGVYVSEIKNAFRNLDMNSWFEGKIVDYDGDMDKVKAILINYKDNLEMEEKKRKDELELVRLKQGNINISANANNANNININITLEQAIESISNIPDSVLNSDEREDLENRLYALEASARKSDKSKAKEKLLSVIKFVAEKGIDATIALLPYLGQVASVLNM
jgi:hypothetical protein